MRRAADQGGPRSHGPPPDKRQRPADQPLPALEEGAGWALGSRQRSEKLSKHKKLGKHHTCCGCNPVSHPDTHIKARLQERRRQEEGQDKNRIPPGAGETHIPFAEAEAVWRAVVAWGRGAVHLVGHVGPRRALRGESAGSGDCGGAPGGARPAGAGPVPGAAPSKHPPKSTDESTGPSAPSCIHPVAA